MAIYKTIGRKRLEYFQFLSLLSDIQNSINNRPLTYRETDVNFEPLTPNSFLKFGESKDFFTESLSGSELALPNRKELVQVLDRRDELFANLKEQWYADYLLSLREASRDMYEGRWEDKISLNEVVLVEAPNKTRPWWQLGRVIELLPGKDGKCRTVRIKRPDKSEAVYSLKHLYPLELRVTPSLTHEETEIVDSEKLDRPHKRRAAIQCRERLENS